MLTNKPIFKSLLELRTQYISRQIVEMFKNDLNRQQEFSLNLQNLYYDFSKNNITQEELNLLIDLAQDCNLKSKIEDMFSGKKINSTENRAVLHTALRSGKPLLIDGHNLQDEISTVQSKIKKFCNDIHSGNITGFSGKKIDTIVNIGIGGSDLGIVLTCEALQNFKIPKMKIHFISSVDIDMAQQVLSQIDYETTMFIIVSKTFTTQETSLNAGFVKNWLEQLLQQNHINNIEECVRKHFIAVSNNLQGCLNFGIHQDNIFLFWEFVGGRYSIWSAVGLALALYIGYENYALLLSGAKAMDEHFRSTDFRYNIPVIMALIGIWHTNICNYGSLLISPYNYCIRSLPSYLQQLEMESNGKSIDLQGHKINYQTCPVIWGESANNAQHAYYQMLHQGTQTIPIDVIITKPTAQNITLFANAVAQSQAFMMGEENDNLHKLFVGNKPTSTILLNEISPYNIGMLLALYEHKVFVQGVIWNINSFDQMGVELGKKLTNKILDKSYKNTFTDCSTEYLLNQI